MCCTAKQMRSSSIRAPPKAVTETLFFLAVLTQRRLGTSKGGSWGQAGPQQSWVMGKWFLPPPYCAGNSTAVWVSLRLVSFHHWYVLLVQSLWQERVQSQYTYVRRMKLTCRCWHFSLSSVFLNPLWRRVVLKVKTSLSTFLALQQEHSCWSAAIPSFTFGLLS